MLLTVKSSMKTNPKSTEISLHIPPQMWQKFKKAMLTDRIEQEEVIGFFFCERHQLSARKIRYLATSWVVPSPDCYEIQSAIGIVLKQEFHLYLLDNYLRHNKLHIIHIHTHPTLENPQFSNIDDRHESEYARFLSSSFITKPRLISGVSVNTSDKMLIFLSHLRVETKNSWFEAAVRFPPFIVFSSYKFNISFFI